jgi:hypothetical protein
VSSAPGSALRSSLREADTELREHLVQVVLDSARADEQPLAVEKAAARELDHRAAAREAVDRFAVGAGAAMSVTCLSPIASASQ